MSNIPNHLLSMLNEQDARHGFPPGTMAAIFQQEVGGNFQKYVDNPATYHYAANAQGQRIAPHSGEISTAFGPFGILDSTAKDPGWGVKPLQDKNDLGEHFRFAADYLAARVKQQGDFLKGIAAYGEGPEYANKIAKNIPGFTEHNPQFAQVASANPPAPLEASPEVPPLPVMNQMVAAPDYQAMAQEQVAGREVPPEWEAFRNWIPRRDELVRDPKQPVNPLASGRSQQANFSDALRAAESMMAQNQRVLQNGWEAMRGWV